MPLPLKVKTGDATRRPAPSRKACTHLAGLSSLPAGPPIPPSAAWLNTRNVECPRGRGATTGQQAPGQLPRPGPVPSADCHWLCSPPLLLMLLRLLLHLLLLQMAPLLQLTLLLLLPARQPGGEAPGGVLRLVAAVVAELSAADWPPTPGPVMQLAMFRTCGRRKAGESLDAHGIHAAMPGKETSWHARGGGPDLQKSARITFEAVKMKRG